MVGVCAPHTGQVPFWERLINQMHLSCSDEIVLMGDFNNVMDSKLNRSYHWYVSREFFKDWMKDRGCLEKLES